MKSHELTFILRNLCTLVGNGVPLPKALATLAQEDTLARHKDVLDSIQSIGGDLVHHPPFRRRQLA